MSGDIAVYFLTFAVVGRLWIVHHHLFATLRTLDPRPMTLNLVYLSMIVLVPFAAQMLGDYGNQPLAAAVYGAVLGVAAALDWVMTRYAAARGFARPERREQVEGRAAARWLSVPAVFLVSVPVAFLSPWPPRRCGWRSSSGGGWLGATSATAPGRASAGAPARARPRDTARRPDARRRPSQR
jgi:uncharacterized membrane protein